MGIEELPYDHVKRRLARGRWHAAYARVMHEHVRKRAKKPLQYVIRQAIETERAKGNQQFAKEFAKEYTTLFSGDKQPKIAQIDSLVQNYKHEPAFFATTQLFSQLSLAFAAEADKCNNNDKGTAAEVQAAKTDMDSIVDLLLKIANYWLVSKTKVNEKETFKILDQGMMELARCTIFCLTKAASVPDYRLEILINLTNLVLKAITDEQHSYVFSTKAAIVESYAQAYVAILAKNAALEKDFDKVHIGWADLDKYSEPKELIFVSVLKSFQYADLNLKKFIIENYAPAHWDNFDLLSKKLAYPNAKGEVTEARKEKAFDKKSIVLKSLALGLEDTNDSDLINLVFGFVQKHFPINEVPITKPMEHLRFIATIVSKPEVGKDIAAACYRWLNDLSSPRGSPERVGTFFFREFITTRNMAATFALTDTIAKEVAYANARNAFLMHAFDVFLDRVWDNPSTFNANASNFETARKILTNLRNNSPDAFFVKPLEILSPVDSDRKKAPHDHKKWQPALKYWIILSRFFQPLDLFWHERCVVAKPQPSNSLFPQPLRGITSGGLKSGTSIGPASVPPTLLLEVLKSNLPSVAIFLVEFICQLQVLHAEHVSKKRYKEALTDLEIDAERVQIMEFEVWIGAYLSHVGADDKVKLDLGVRTALCQLLTTIRTLFACQRRDKDANSVYVQDWLQHVLKWTFQALYSVDSQFNPTSSKEQTTLAKYQFKLEDFGTSKEKDGRVVASQLQFTQLRYNVLNSISKDWLTTCLETVAAAANRQQVDHFKEAQLMQLFEATWKATIPAVGDEVAQLNTYDPPHTPVADKKKGGNKKEGTLDVLGSKQRKGSFSSEAANDGARKSGTLMNMLGGGGAAGAKTKKAKPDPLKIEPPVPIISFGVNTPTRDGVTPTIAGGDGQGRTVALTEPLPYKLLVLLLFFCAEQLYVLDDKADIIVRKEALSDLIFRDLNSPDVFKKLEAVKKLSLVFSFRDSLTYFDHNVKFFATNIVYQPVSVGSEIVKDIVPRWLKELQLASEALTKSSMHLSDQQKTDEEVKRRHRLLNHVTKIQFQETLQSLPKLESTRTVFPQLFSNVMCDVIDLMNDLSAQVRTACKQLVLNMLANDPLLLLKTLFAELTGEDLVRQKTSLVRLSRLVRTFEEIPAHAAFVMFGHLLGLIKWYQSVEDEEQAQTRERDAKAKEEKGKGFVSAAVGFVNAAFGVASSSSAASKSLEEKKEDPKIKKQSEARKHGLEIQVKVLPIMATLIQSLHGSKFGDIKKDGYHTYLVNADGSLFYSKKIAFNKDGKKSDSLQRMFPTDLEVDLSPAAISPSLGSLNLFTTPLAVLFNLYEIRINQLHLMRRFCSRNPEEVSIFKTTIFYASKSTTLNDKGELSPQGTPVMSSSTGKSPLLKSTMPKASRNSGTAKGYYNNEDILTFSKRVLMPPATMDLPDPLVPIFVSLEVQRLRGWVRVIESMIRNFTKENTFTQADLMEINELFSTVAKLHPSQENLLASILGCYITMVTRFKPFFRTRGYTFIFKTIFEIFVSAKQNMNHRVAEAVINTCRRFYIIHGESFVIQLLHTYAPLLTSEVSKVMLDSFFDLVSNIPALEPDLYKPDGEKSEPVVNDELGVFDEGAPVIVDPNDKTVHPKFELQSIVKVFMTAIAYEPFAETPIKLLSMFRALLPQIKAASTAEPASKNSKADMFFFTRPVMADVLLSSIVKEHALGKQNVRRVLGKSKAVEDFREEGLLFVLEFINNGGRIEVQNVKTLFKLLDVVLEHKFEDKSGKPVAAKLLAEFLEKGKNQPDLQNQFLSALPTYLDMFAANHHASIGPLLAALARIPDEKDVIHKVFKNIWSYMVHLSTVDTEVGESFQVLLISMLKRDGKLFANEFLSVYLKKETPKERRAAIVTSLLIPFAISLTKPDFPSLLMEQLHPGVVYHLWNNLCEFARIFVYDSFDARSSDKDTALAKGLVLLKICCLFALPDSVMFWRRIAAVMQPVLSLPSNLGAHNTWLQDEHKRSHAPNGSPLNSQSVIPAKPSTLSPANSQQAFVLLERKQEREVLLLDSERFRWELMSFVCSTPLPLGLYLRSAIKQFSSFVELEAQYQDSELKDHHVLANEASKFLFSTDKTKSSIAEVLKRIQSELAALPGK